MARIVRFHTAAMSTGRTVRPAMPPVLAKDQLARVDGGKIKLDGKTTVQVRESGTNKFGVILKVGGKRKALEWKKNMSENEFKEKVRATVAKMESAQANEV